MAERETQQASPDTSLEKAKENLQEAQRSRKETKGRLRAAKCDLETTRQTLARLHETEPILREDAQRLQRQQSTYTAAQATAHRLQDQRAENTAERTRLNSRVQAARRMIETKEAEIVPLRKALRDIKIDVTKKAVAVSKKAAKRIRDKIWAFAPNLSTLLLSGASAGYLAIILANTFHDWCFYQHFGIAIFGYSQLQDFVVPRDVSIISVLLWGVLAGLVLKGVECLTLPGFVELIARFLSWLATSLWGKLLIFGPLFLLSFVIVPGALAWRKAAPIKAADTAVHVITVQELKPVKSLVHIGSSSTHAFFRTTEQTTIGEGKKPEGAEKKTVILPLSGIVCINDAASICEPNDAPAGVELKLDEIKIKPEHNPWIPKLLAALQEHVTEDGVRQFITTAMNCRADQKIEVSEFIRFDRNESSLKSDENNDRKHRERQKIAAFAAQWKEAGTQWKVFGFASADGEQTGNTSLSAKRAAEVESLLCDELERACETITHQGLGEHHPINGVANGRSARIAVCTPQDAVANSPTSKR